MQRAICSTHLRLAVSRDRFTTPADFHAHIVELWSPDGNVDGPGSFAGGPIPPLTSRLLQRGDAPSRKACHGRNRATAAYQ
jgi:hypothetical protein